MAESVNVTENLSQKIREKREEKSKIMCIHCNKGTSSAIQCGKCEKWFHSSCLIQAATQKSAVCRHVPAYACDDFWATEKSLFQMIVKHLEEKNQFLIENNELLKVNQEFLQEKLKNAENVIKELSKIPPKSPLASESDISSRNVDLGRPQDVTLQEPDARVTILTSNNSDNLTKEINNENDGFQTVHYKKRPKNNRPTPKKGASNDALLKVAKNTNKDKMWIFISGLAPETKADDIINFLKKYKLDNDCYCDKMVTKKDRHYSSFKVGVPKQNHEAVMSSDLWPTGTTINHFLHVQRPWTSHRRQLQNPEAQDVSIHQVA